MPLFPLLRSTGLACFLGAAVAVDALADGWEPLFNGKDLSGWRVVNGSAPFEVIDGAIVGTAVHGSPNTFLATERSFGDFVFEAEFRVDGPLNSGVQFRSISQPSIRGGRVHGYQCEIDPSARAWTGGIYDEARRGWLYPVDLNLPAKAAYRHGEWTRMRVECIGPSIRTWINDVPVSHLIDDLTTEGLIALQVHSINQNQRPGDQVRFRNLRIKTSDLQPAPLMDIPIVNTRPNHLSEAEQALGWKLLWDGATTRGWRSLSGSSFPTQGWEIKDGELTVLGASGGDIVTEESFGPFELQLEFFITEGANSGIKYFLLPNTSIGLEYQILDDQRHPDALRGKDGNRRMAGLYDLYASANTVSGRPVPREAGRWHQARIVTRADGSTEHWLNGFLVTSFNRFSEDFKARVAGSKFATQAGFGQAEQSPILLQDHGDVVRFRSIKIRSLAEPPNRGSEG
jgi:hypothetical protein